MERRRPWDGVAEDEAWRIDRRALCASLLFKEGADDAVRALFLFHRELPGGMLSGRTPFRMKKRLCLFSMCGMLIAALAAAGVKVRVTGDHVNLRPLAGGRSAVVSQVNAGDLLFAPNGIDGEWVEVEAPRVVDLWIYGELVREGAVSASRVQIRSGPGTNYRVVGVAEKGDRVEARGRQGDWLKIAPLPQCTLWISRDYVKPITATVPKPVEPKPAPVVVKPVEPVVRPAPRPVRPVIPAKPVPVPRPVPVKVSPVPVPVRPSPPTPIVPEPVIVSSSGGRLPPELRRLVSGADQGRAVEYVGILRPAGLVWGRPSRYRLVMRDDAGRALSLCYLVGNEAQLARIVGRTLHVTGREYWLQGVKTSVVVPEQIIRKD